MIFIVPKWRNWQTRWTQNPVGRKVRAGSTPAFGTILFSISLQYLSSNCSTFNLFQSTHPHGDAADIKYFYISLLIYYYTDKYLIIKKFNLLEKWLNRI
jgi:hypothetical protein